MKKITLFFCAIIATATSLFATEHEYPNSFNFNRAIDAIEVGDYDNAIKYLKLELMENPDNGYAHYFMGAIHSVWDYEYGEALKHTNKALKLIPKTDYEFYASVFYGRSQIYLALGDTTKAIDDISKAIVLQSDESLYYKVRAQIYYEIKDYEKADADYLKILSIDETDLNGYMGLGRNLNAQGRHYEAIDKYSYVISLYPYYNSAYSFRAESYLKLEEYNKAIDDIITSIELNDSYANTLLMLAEIEAYDILIAKLKSKCMRDPDVVMWYYYTAEILKDHGDYLNAIEYYKKASKIEVDPSGYNDLIAECYSEIGDFKSALKYYDKAIKRSESDYDKMLFMIYHADCHYNMGKAKKAIAEMGDVIELNPDFYYGYYRRGFYKDNILDIEGAIEDYSMSIKLAPNYAYAYLGRADMYRLKGDTALAMADYRKVIELDTIPRDGACAQYAFLELGMTDKAIDFMNQIIENEPDNSGHYYDAACVYARLGNTAKSLEYLEIALKMGYKKFHHISIDDDLDTIRNLPQYKNLIRQYKK